MREDPSIWDSRTSALGRPSFFPFARALRIPALTRSTIKLRSSSATAPRMVKIIFPVRPLIPFFEKMMPNLHFAARSTPANFSTVVTSAGPFQSF